MTSLDENFTMERISDGVCQVELNVSYVYRPFLCFSAFQPSFSKSSAQNAQNIL